MYVYNVKDKTLLLWTTVVGDVFAFNPATDGDSYILILKEWCRY